LKLNDGNYYVADYGCCTFNTRRKNSFQHITRIQLAPCSKTNLPKIGDLIGFYLKVDMSKVPGYTGPAYPLYLLMLTVLTTSF
jgi:hypothetical protein